MGTYDPSSKKLGPSQVGYAVREGAEVYRAHCDGPVNGFGFEVTVKGWLKKFLYIGGKN